MSDTCHYHPQSRASATCPVCQQAVCDRCRAAGDFSTCGNCLGGGGAAGPASGGGAWADDGTGLPPPTCTKHPTLLAEMQCLNCLHPFCLDCCPSGYCVDCAPQMGNRVQQQLSYQPTGGAGLGDVEAAYEGYTHLGMGYDEEEEVGPGPGGAPAAPRPKRPKGGGPAKKGGASPGKGAKGGSKAPTKGAKRGAKGLAPWPWVAAGLGLLALAGGGAYWALGPGGPGSGGAAPALAGVKFSQPAEGAQLKGVHNVVLTVSSPEAVKQAELTIDGRYWARWKAPLPGPQLTSEWITTLPQFRKGKHRLELQVEYQDGQQAKAQREVQTAN